ncbi:hypothetical protein NQ176_g1536 [Zarea fungicola]|uniref:Uncharacterized protein n=1 Tax=Zarea fungicola TaxID=93591 RepID=A0ACC1NSC3_9HYPO|nr:hypothetical protein NQ176_g1536 [Lecanicillium fungicola]
MVFYACKGDRKSCIPVQPLTFSSIPSKRSSVFTFAGAMPSACTGQLLEAEVVDMIALYESFELDEDDAFQDSPNNLAEDHTEDLVDDVVQLTVVILDVDDGMPSHA